MKSCDQPDRRACHREGSGSGRSLCAALNFNVAFYTHRYAGHPLECRGVVAAYDQRTDSVTIWSSTQVVHSVRREAASPAAARSARPLRRS